MLPKKNRVDTKGIALLFKEGKFINASDLTFKFILTPELFSPRISFVAPKSIAKLAVKRNLLRRRGYVALEKYIGKVPAGLLGVFVFKKYQDDVSKLKDDIKNVLQKLRI